MNKIIKGFVAVMVSVVIFTACDNDFDLVTDKVEIPVVYAIINAADTAQYFRVERAFIDENISALEIAQIPDSLYYADAVVTLTRVTTGEAWIMDEVDGNLEGYPRQDGVFATAPNTLYKLRTADITLEPEEQYMLTIDIGDNRPQIVATTVLIKPPFLATPADEGGLNIDPARRFRINWNNNSTNAIYDAYVRLFYDETIDGVTTPKSIDWSLLKNSEINEIDVLSTGFYDLVGNSLVVDPSITRQQMGASFTLISGSIEISDYIRIGQANLGITSSGEIPVYEGSLSYGLGLFGSRFTDLRDDLVLTQLTRDSLSSGPRTGDLGFL
ncbi:MAG: hypothetical protein QNK64_05355 [Saprospiraceae bacterium]|jgi:hypothetical protein|tara:strand:+ start:3600 stop:4583 length:984 start_codon:yes stop_codon:yes gene_type:complete